MSMGGSTRLAADIRALSAIERPPASPGEEAAARWVQARLQATGLAAGLEPFSFNPDYWAVWGAHGVAATLSAGLALAGSGSARVGALLAGVTAASFWGELTTEFRPLRRLPPARTSYNVLARLPNPRASRLVVISAHHDAPHSGLVFHPELFQTGARLLGPDAEAPAALRLPFAAMLTVALAAAARAAGLRGRLVRRLLMIGGSLSALFAFLMRDIGRSPVSPGANDDASAVAVLLALAESLAREPPPGLEVWFLSTGSEEGILGGMDAFVQRHQAELRERRAFVLNLEVLGSGRPVYLEAEGFLRRFPYHDEAVRAAAEVAAEPPFAAVRPLKIAPFATDALIPTRYGIPAVTIASVSEEGYVPHYHWPTDTPENLDLGSVAQAHAFCRRLVDRLSQEAATA